MATRLTVKVGADTTGFNAGLTRAKMQANAFAQNMRSVTSGIARNFAGMFSVVAATMAIKRTIEWADTLADTSRRLGINVEKLQEMEYAAVQTGSSLSSLVNTIEKLKKSQADAGRGLSTAIIGMGALGLGTGDSVDVMLSKLAAKAQSGELTGLTGPLKDVAGRGASELIPALMQWEKLAKEAREVGVIMEESHVQVLEKVKDQFTYLTRYMTANLAPAIAWTTEKMMLMVAAVRGVGAAIGTLAGMDPAKRKAKVADRWKAFREGGFKGLIGERIFGNMAEAVSGEIVNDPMAAFTAEMRKARKAIAEMRASDTFKEVDVDLPDPLQKKGRMRAQVDSLAKVGLFTSSGLNAQSVADSQRKRMVMHLAAIERNTKQSSQDQFA